MFLLSRSDLVNKLGWWRALGGMGSVGSGSEVGGIEPPLICFQNVTRGEACVIYFCIRTYDITKNLRKSMLVNPKFTYVFGHLNLLDLETQGNIAHKCATHIVIPLHGLTRYWIL